MDRPAQSLERLPLLALEIICSYIDDEGGSEDLRRSLWAFSLTSRRCAAAAAVQRFSQMHLRLRSADTMAARIQLLIDEGLDKGERFRYVRRLRVSGGMSRREADIIRAKEQALQGRALYPSPRATEQALEALKDDRDISEVDRLLHTKEASSIVGTGSTAHDIRHVFGDDLHPFCRPRYDRHGRIIHGGSVSLDAVKVTFHSDDAWLPLAKLVHQLPGLRDLVWDATNYLPRDVLAAIHETPSLCAEARGGGCRIHMHQFALHSLSHYRGHTTQSPISEDEYALVTSANLYSVIAMVQSRMMLDRVSFTGHALLQEMLGRGRSPNLRHVWFSQVSGSTFFGLNGETEEEQGPDWQGFYPGLHDQSSTTDDTEEKGKQVERVHRLRNRTPLTSLVFWNNVPSTVYTNWLHGGDYSKLRNLTLFWDRDLIEDLAVKADDGRFGALDSFTLLGARDGHYRLLDPGAYYGDYPDGTCYEDDYAQNDEDIVEQNLLMYLFHMLPPLRSLQYEGTLSPWTARHIYKHHGPTLRRLSLMLKEPADMRPVDTWLARFDTDAAHDLAGRCPNLEELSLDMQRSGGDSDEARAYRALSNEMLKNLERLELRLWCRIGPKPEYVEPDHAIHGFGWTPGVDQAMPTSQEEDGVAGAIDLDVDVDDQVETNNRRPSRERDWDKVRMLEDIPMDILKGAFVDCAIDEKLARSIFAELEFEPSGKSRFQHLRIEIAREAEPEDPGMGDAMFISLLRWLGRSYVVERSLGRGGQVVARETDPTKTIKSGRLWQHLASQRTGDNAVKVIRDAFQALWPNKTESWWESWSSAPLDTDCDTSEMSLEERFGQLIDEQKSDDEITDTEMAGGVLNTLDV